MLNMKDAWKQDKQQLSDESLLVHHVGDIRHIDFLEALLAIQNNITNLWHHHMLPKMGLHVLQKPKLTEIKHFIKTALLKTVILFNIKIINKIFLMGFKMQFILVMAKLNVEQLLFQSSVSHSNMLI